jgi:hypothetical protein
VPTFRCDRSQPSATLYVDFRDDEVSIVCKLTEFGVSTSRSLALVTYEAGPMPEPCIMLAVMDLSVEVSPWYTVQ